MNYNEQILKLIKAFHEDKVADIKDALLNLNRMIKHETPIPFITNVMTGDILDNIKSTLKLK